MIRKSINLKMVNMEKLVGVVIIGVKVGDVIVGVNVMRGISMFVILLHIQELVIREVVVDLGMIIKL